MRQTGSYPWMLELLRFIAFPTLLGGGLLAAAVGLRSNVPPSPLLLSILTAVGACVIALERIIPLSVEWNTSRDDTQVDLTYLLINCLIHPSLSGLTFWIFSGMGRRLSENWIGTESFWPTSLPFWIQVALAVLLREFGHYWLHQYTHRHGRFLWKLHSIHHEPTRLYWLNANRMHLGNIALDACFGIGPLLFLGPSPQVYFMVGVVIGVMNSITHANIDFLAGPLRWVFNLPEWHRWHHERSSGKNCTNFGDVLIVWDWAFGTRSQNDAAFESGNIGLDRDAELPRGYFRQLLYPLLGDHRVK